jgi:hypothetical protein
MESLNFKPEYAAAFNRSSDPDVHALHELENALSSMIATFFWAGMSHCGDYGVSECY